MERVINENQLQSLISESIKKALNETAQQYRAAGIGGPKQQENVRPYDVYLKVSEAAQLCYHLVKQTGDQQATQIYQQLKGIATTLRQIARV